MWSNHEQPGHRVSSRCPVQRFPKSVKDPILDNEINVLGTLRLLEASRRAGVEKIIYSSTGGALYGEP